MLDTNPWETVQVDMIGTWTCKFKLTKEGKTVQTDIKALTIADRATSWPEFAAARNFSSAGVTQLFDKECLCRYPRSTTVIHDNDNEFNASEFQKYCRVMA